jgi:hypothetical protein
VIDPHHKGLVMEIAAILVDALAKLLEAITHA